MKMPFGARERGGFWIFSQSVLKREEIKFCADQIPWARGAACPSGVRSLIVALGSLSNRTGIENGFFGSILRACVCVYTSTVCACVFMTWVGRKVRLLELLLRKFCLS